MKNILYKFTPQYVKEILVAKARGGPLARQILFWTAFSESSVFLVPPDVVLIAILLTGVQNWKYYATLTTIASVLGGIFGYVIGFFLFDTIGEWIITTYNLGDSFLEVSNLYDTYAFWVVFISAFSPIPYKLFTITAGVFHINFFMFVVASLIGRGLRFFIVSYLVHRYGARFVAMIQKYFNIVTFIVALLIIIGIILFI